VPPAAALIAALAALATASTASTQDARPAVRLMDDNPVVVRGSHFAPEESVAVRVVVRGRTPFAKTVLAGRLGGFTARFESHALPRCPAYVITAVGASGRKATLRQLIPPPCGIDLHP
jgi:hypothetical protein